MSKRQFDEDRAAIVAALLRHTVAAIDSSTKLSALTVFRRSQPTKPKHNLYPTSLAIAVQGRKRLMLGTETYVYDQGSFLVTSVDMPVISQIIEASATSPFLAMLYKLDMKIVRAVIAEMAFRGTPAQEVVRGITTCSMTPEIMNVLTRLIHLLESPADLVMLGPAFERELIYRVLMSGQGGRLRQVAAVGTPSNKVSLAIRHIQQHYRKPLRIAELARLVKSGASTLQHHFRTVTNVSPLQYQKQLRLHEARRLMLSEDINVSEAAIAVGYASSSQLTREYSRLFRLPPQRDIAALKMMSQKSAA